MRLHSLLILSWMVLWAILPGHAGDNSASGKGRKKMQRILFHPAPTVEWLKGLKVETLGKSPKGTWLAADDAVALELLKRDKTTLALYPTLAVYQEAMEGLKGTEVSEAIHLRLILVESNPQTESVPDFYFPEREGLEALAVAALAPGAPSSLDVAFRSQLDLFLGFNGVEPYRGQDKISLLSGLFEAVNRLNWEEEGLRRHPLVDLESLDPGLEKSRKELALETQRGERALGIKFDHEPSGRVFDQLKRGVFATPVDEMLVRGISEGHEPVQKWKDGFVSIWPEFSLQNIPMGDKEKTFLYFDAGQCHADFLSSTKSQLIWKFEKQSKISKAADASSYIAGLRLSLILQLLGRRSLVAKFNPALADRMGKQAEMEIAGIKTFLALHKPWRRDRKGVAGIRAELQSSVPEAEFWRSWSAAKFWDFEQERMGWIVDAKAKVLTQIPAGL